MGRLPSPAAFAPREWLALCPRGQHPMPGGWLSATGAAPDGGTAWKAPPADPAAAARASDPLTRDALLRELPPLFRGLARAQFAIWPVGRRIAVRFYGFHAAALAVLGLGWSFDDGRFGAAQIAASFAGYACGIAVLAIFPFIHSNRAGHAGKGESGDGPDMGNHYLAGLARWSQLVRGVDAAADRNVEVGTHLETASKLVSHEENDPFCPCDRSSCAGGIARRGGVQQLVKILFLLVTQFGSVLCLVVTPFFTFAAQFWTTWWSAVLGVLLLFMTCYLLLPIDIGIPSSPSATLDLRRRLGKRAADVAFASFFERYSIALEGGASEVELLELIGSRELYVDVHHHLTRALSWGFGVQLVGPINASLYLVVFVFYAAITGAAGSCIPFGPIARLLWPLGWFAVDLSMVSLGNLAVDDLTGLPPAPAEVVTALRAHDRLLSSFLGIERYRTAVVTVITLTVGRDGKRHRNRDLDRERPPRGVLLEHEAEDPFCTCPSEECAGRLVASVGYVKLLDGNLRMWAAGFGTFYALQWTAFVAFGPVFWTTWWCIILGLLGIAGSWWWFFPNTWSRFTTQLPLLRLDLRLQHRAMSRALRCLLRRYRSGLLEGAPGPPPAPAGDELYVQLHALLTASWQTRMSSLFINPAMIAFWGGGFLVVAVFTLATGPCITAWNLAFLLSFFAVTIADLVLLATSNSQVSHIGAQYAAARRTLHLYLARAPGAPEPWRTAAAAHAGVGFAAVRGFAATGITLGVGVWSVMRGNGVVATGEIFCPSS
ncbi:hypothetical protein DFJ74DRAFT_707271 [Hyaloraphidium curvatum]|nr:hypothetical protein DFJ74DRAFT_707271 [Hyaloraphidium curvatum]